MTALAATLLALLGLAPERVLDDPELLSHVRLVALAATLWLVKERVDAVRRLIGALRDQPTSPRV